MSAIWDKAKADALKILGNKGEVPDLPGSVDSAGDTLGKANGEFDKAREALEAKVLAVQNANDGVSNSLKQFRAKIEKSDFKLDSKDKDDQKKIQQARDALVGVIDDAIKAYADDDKMLDEVDKHLEQLGKYQCKAKAP